MIRLFEANLNGPRSREQALVLTALCVGGMVLARGIDDQRLADDIRNAAHKQALKTTDWSDGRPRARSDRHQRERRNKITSQSLSSLVSRRETGWVGRPFLRSGSR